MKRIVFKVAMLAAITAGFTSVVHADAAIQQIAQTQACCTTQGGSQCCGSVCSAGGDKCGARGN